MVSENVDPDRASFSSGTTHAVYPFGDAANTGLSPNAGPRSITSVDWVVKNTEVGSGLLLDTNVLYFTNENGLLAVGIEDGIKWKVPGWGRATPLVVDETVYSYQYELLAVESSTGLVKWTVLGASSRYLSSPNSADGVLVAIGENSIVGVNIETGAEMWGSETHGAAPYSTPAISNGTIFYGTPDPQPDSGIGHGNNITQSWDATVYALDLRTGIESWRFKIVGLPTSTALSDGLVYLGTHSGKVHALAEASGEQVWEADLGGKISIVAASDSFILAGTDTHSGGYSGPGPDGKVHQAGEDLRGTIYALDPETGEALWSFVTDDKDIESILFDSQTIFVAANTPPRLLWERPGPVQTEQAGHYIAIDLATGQELWRHFTEGRVFPPAIGDGKLYIGSPAGIQVIN